jgi:hypothetical protein
MGLLPSFFSPSGKKVLVEHFGKRFAENFQSPLRVFRWDDGVPPGAVRLGQVIEGIGGRSSSVRQHDKVGMDEPRFVTKRARLRPTDRDFRWMDDGDDPVYPDRSWLEQAASPTQKFKKRSMHGKPRFDVLLAVPSKERLAQCFFGRSSRHVFSLWQN